MAQELIYNGETDGKFCAICKLDYYDNQKILFCPNCESLFHEEHLITWLNLNSECPVCARDFSKEIEKYSLRDSNINNEEEISVDNLPFRELKFGNSKSNEEPETLSIFNRFVAIIIGLFFLGFCFIVMYTMSSPFPQVLVVTLVDYPLYLMGLFIVKAAITKTKESDIIDSWKDIIFTKKEIIVKNLDLSLKKISVEDILTIKLQTNNITPKNSTTSYLITLKLTCLKKKENDFGEIYKSTDKLRRDHIYNCLAYQIRNFYHIQTSPSEVDFLTKLFSEQGKILAIATIVYVLLKVAVLILL